jgi:nitrogen fixation protein FixH
LWSQINWEDEMKRVIMILTAVILFAGYSYANNLNMEKKVGDITVKAVIENNPLNVGDNSITIELLDPDGNATTDAEMAVYYYMPSMPAMNYEVKAAPKGKYYSAVIKPTMPGEWAADIKAKKGDEDSLVVSFSFDAK